MPAESPPKRLGPLVKQLREAAGLTLFELAKRTGLNRSVLARIEDGTTAQPSNRSLSVLARALNIDPEVFYDALWWQDTETRLPSPRVYLRSKYHLNEAQIAEIEASLRRVREHPTNNTNHSL